MVIEVTIFSYVFANSSFVLDAFKRCYSNEDTATKAIPHFWENFDKEGWSIWKSGYKYSAELKKIYMTCNLVSGMMQRLDKLRKNAFASILILGEDDNNSVEGVWVLRGQQLAFDVSLFVCAHMPIVNMVVIHKPFVCDAPSTYNSSNYIIKCS